MNINLKLRLIRLAESLEINQLSTLIGISSSRIIEIESNSCEIEGPELLQYTTNLRLQKYTLWLMSGMTSLAAGQIKPALALLQHEK